MGVEQLVGRRVRIGPAGPFSAMAASVAAVDQNSQSLLLELGLALQAGAEIYRYAVARPRLQRDELVDLLGNGSLGCNVTFVPDHRFNSERPFDVSWWRGGSAGIADLTLSVLTE